MSAPLVLTIDPERISSPMWISSIFGLFFVRLMQRKQEKPQNSNGNHHISQIEHWEGISSKRKVDHIHHMTIENCIDDISKSAGKRQEKGPIPFAFMIKKQSINRKATHNQNTCIK